MATVPMVNCLDGAQMPQLAFGLYLIPRDQTFDATTAALAAGYRHFDSASFYDNEAESGAALRAWLAEGHDRSEIYVTTKVWTTDLVDGASALRSAEISINELGLGAVDLVMVHWPVPGKHVECYKALEALAQAGKTKALGISNYSPQDHEELMKVATIPPTVNTFEVNPFLFRKSWIDYFQAKGIAVQAYKPLQRGGAVLGNDVVGAIASRLGKTAAQVCIRWALQKGLVVLVKSTQPVRMAENMAVFGFELTPEDVAGMDGLTTEEALQTAQAHYEKRRSGTPAPWGDGPRPEAREASGIHQRREAIA
uniref:NADP-dependent oxidoreductase domain-containing protein n=1 Tax=Pyrodinium bahamense TaxID=73915 RepID=A0A7R9ZVQ7_9DINO